MKIVTASQLISCVMTQDDISNPIEIQANSINKFRATLLQQSVKNELTLFDFRELSRLYPEYIEVSPIKVTILQNQTFARDIKKIYRYNDHIEDSEILRIWKDCKNGH